MKTIFVFIVLLVVLWIALFKILKRLHLNKWKWDLNIVVLIIIEVFAFVSIIVIINIWVNMFKDMIAMIF